MSTSNILPRPPLRRNDLTVDMHELYAYLHRMLVPIVDQTYQSIDLTPSGGGPLGVQFVQQMKQVTVYIPSFQLASADNVLTLSGIPAIFAPVNDLTQNVVVQMSNLPQLGAMYIAAGGTVINYAPANLSLTGWNVDGLNKGVYSYFVQWFIA